MDVVVDLESPPGCQLRVPMERVEFDRLEEADALPTHAEWYDGLCVVTGAPFLRHTVAASELLRLLFAVAPQDHLVVSQCGWTTPIGFFIPDLLTCHVDTEGSKYLEAAPLLVVEVLSPSTRQDDLNRKRDLYAASGADWYWIVDPVAPWVAILERQDDRYVEVQRIGPGESATAVGPYRLTLAPDALIRRRSDRLGLS